MNSKKIYKTLLNKDKTGEGIIKDMIYYEFKNSEYPYNQKTNSALYALGLTAEEVQKSTKFKKGLVLAIERIDNEEYEYE